MKSVRHVSVIHAQQLILHAGTGSGIVKPAWDRMVVALQSVTSIGVKDERVNRKGCDK